MRRIVTFVLAIAICGCGKPGETTLSGVVKYQNKPLGNGYVLLKFDDGTEANGNIAIDGSGNFSIRTPMTGHAKVAVGSPKPPDPALVKGRAGTPKDVQLADPGKWVEIPEKYSNPETSGKDVTVSSGSNNITIELE